ncbi:MAG: amidohydrolase [Saprospiraceae bacterium]|nr:amidohydrolase [Saprospiraceae bacterium]
MKTPKAFVRLLFIAIVFISFQCSQQQKADLIILDAEIYTMDTLLPSVQAMAIKDGKILAMGTDEEIMKWAGSETEVEKLNGQFIIPGLIEGHAHFSYLGKSLLDLNFMNVTSWDEAVRMVEEAAKKLPEGTWIEGRGWHQEKWQTIPQENVNGYPFHDALSAVTPNHPVILRHASGHSLFANKKAMDLAGIQAETPSPSGGVIVRSSDGEAIGVFEERAMSLISDPFNQYLETLDEDALQEKWLMGIKLAQEECLSHGITSFQDAGSSFEEVEQYRKMAEASDLKVRLYAMVRHASDVLAKELDKLPIIDAGNGYFTCRAIKSELDGELGVFGAWKLKPYADKPGYTGQNTTSIEELKKIADLAVKHKMQLCVHAIGDKANREFLNICDSLFKINPEGNTWRWRSEHAQHLDTADIKRFAPLGILASMQGIHCTSDAPFVVKRLGQERSRTGAYAWRSLLDAGVIINNGTDAPVESIDPIECFYASVTRKRKDSWKAFFPEQSMTRHEGLYSYTMANAMAAFEEKNKGSLSVGKYADFVILSNNLITCTEAEILKTEVLRTYVGGKLAYQKAN